MIKINNLVANYTTVRGQVTAVDHVTFEIPDGVTLGSRGNRMW